MQIFAFVFLILSTLTIEAQTRFRLDDASKLVDVDLEVTNCDDGESQGRCGPLTVRFFRKNSTKPFQTVTLPETSMWDAVPKANVTRRYDDQSVINFADFNFDGLDDVAICDGTNGGYGMPSYQIYLYSKALKRFVLSRAFTKMNEGGLGMFETDPKKKMHFVHSKSGCCWHRTIGFDVSRGRPRKIYELTQDGTQIDPRGTVQVTTRKLIKNRWRTSVTYEIPDQPR